MKRNRYGRFSLSWAVWLVLAALGVQGLRDFRVDNSLGAWMPELSHGDTARSFIVVGMEGTEAQVSEIARRLRGSSSVSLCIDPEFVKRTSLITGITPENFVVSESEDYFGIYVFPHDSIDDEMFVKDIRQVLDEFESDSSDRFALGGPAIFHVALNRWSQDRLPLIALLILIVGTLLTWVFTGRFRVAIVGTGAILLSQVVLLGGLAASGRAIDLSLSLIPPMMMALGYSYTIHRALRPQIGRILLLCFLTTAAGFGAFLFTGLAPIRDFAFFGIIGLALVLLAVVMLVPGAETKNDSRHSIRWHQWLLVGCKRSTNGSSYFILVTGVLLTLAAVFFAGRLRFATIPLGYFPDRAEVRQDFLELNERLTGMLPFQVEIIGQSNLDDLLDVTPGVRKIVDLSSLYPTGRNVYLGLANTEALPNLIAAQPRWQEWAETNGVELRFTGVAAQLAGIERIVKKTALMSLPVLAIIAALVGGVVARSRLFALLSVWINLMPVIVLIVITGLFGIELNLPSIMIGAIAIGVSLDDTIHLAAAFRHHRSTTMMLNQCGHACAGSSLVAAACMSLFAISAFGPTAQFGVLMAFAILAALAGDLLILPAALFLRKHSHANHKN